MIEFWVPGRPIQQGSKRIGRHPRTKRPILIDDNDKDLRAWRKTVTVHAHQAMHGHTLITGPVELRLVFYLYRPGGAKPDATPTADKKPDWDKLERAIGDALTGVVWRDDAQVTTCFTRKRVAPHGKPMGVRIAARPDPYLDA